MKDTLQSIKLEIKTPKSTQFVEINSNASIADVNKILSVLIAVFLVKS